MNKLGLLKYIFNAFFLVICLVTLSSGVYAADVKIDAVKATQNVDKIFERMLLAVEKGQLDKLPKTINLLHDLAQNIDSVTGANMEEDLQNLTLTNDTKKIQTGIQRTIFYSIEYLMYQCMKTVFDKNEKTARIKNAYTLYLLLDYYIKEIDFEKSKLLRNDFRMYNALASSNSGDVTKICSEIKKELKDFVFNLN